MMQLLKPILLVSAVSMILIGIKQVDTVHLKSIPRPDIAEETHIEAPEPILKGEVQAKAEEPKEAPSEPEKKPEKKSEPVSDPNNCEPKQYWNEYPPYNCIDKPTEQPVVDARPTTVSGSKTDWMAAAGIPQSEWSYVDYIVNREASWDPQALNSSSGACSLAQALPCSKIPGDWTDPVNALKWQYEYVTARYGGYEGAYKFWIVNHWY